MNILVCKNPKNYNLTAGKSYTVLEQIDHMITILNDTGKAANYNINLFEPLAVPFSINIENNVVTVTKNNNTTETFSTLEFVNKQTSYISCGIKEFSGINALTDYIDNIDNVNTEQKIEILTAVLNHYLTDDISMLLISTNTSTDINDEAVQTQLVQRLHLIRSSFNQLLDVEISDINNYNPNSGNQIVLWILKVIH